MPSEGNKEERERGPQTEAGWLAGFMAPWGKRTLKQSVPEKLHPVQGTSAGAAHEEMCLMGGTP